MHASRVGFILLLIAGCASSSAAQDIAGSFDQLRVLVKPGDTITVTDGAGQEVKGTISALSSSSLEVLVAGQRRALLPTDVQTIRQRRPDPLANGAKWGFGIGAGLGLLAGLAVDGEGETSAAIIPVVTLVYAGIGAGIGVGIDAMISSDQVIYSRSAPSSTEPRLLPLLTRARKGIVLSIGF
jgi:hypothetical protein